MLLKKSTFIALVVGLPTFLFPAISHAQLAIEKIFIAKSKLANSIWKKHDPSSTQEIDHSAWDGFLAKYLKADDVGINRLAYKSVSSADKLALQSYLSALQAIDVTKLNKNEQYAFWINLYNASTVNVGIKNYPIKSILDIKSNPLDLKGPFNDKIAKVNGQALTLDIIESGIVRPIWNDPRLHYAFNCAAISCPNLSGKAYRGKTLNAQLNKAAVNFVNHPRGIQIQNGKLTASKIYFWYSEDFGGEKGVLNHIKQYANDNLKQKLAGKTKIDYYVYDWALNQQ